MTFHFRLVLSLLTAASLLAGTAQAAQESLLILDQSSGVAAVQRNGKRLALNPEDAVQEQDRIVTDRTGRMKLNLARHGFIEVGANSEVGIERLPFATFARDLKSIFSVSKGYFRVVWKHPQLSTHWPLFVTLAGHRIGLTSGEYFFSNTGSEQRACVAAGQMDVQTAGSTEAETETIKPPACVRFVANTTPQLIARNPDDWIAVRRGYDIDATTTSMLAAVVAAPARPPSPAPARAPIIAAASSTAAPAAPVIARAPVTPAPKASPKAAAASQPKLPIAAVVSTATGGDWALNIASYTEVAAAEQEVARLRGAGYEASSQSALVNGRNWYRVQLRGFADQAAARAAALKLKTELGLQNIWVLKP